MGRKVFTAGSILRASEVNTYLMDQTVQTFAGTAERGTAIGTATEGMISYLADSNNLSIYDGSAWNNIPITINTTVSSLNTTVTGFTGTWTSYTPTFSNFTLGNGVMNARYTQIGKTVIATGGIIWGSTTSLTGLWDMAPPVTGAANRNPFATRIGQAFYTNATPNALYFGDLLTINGDWNSLTSLRFGVHNSSATYATHTDVGPTTPFTFASGFRVNWQLIYEAS